MEQRTHYRIAGWSCIVMSALCLAFVFFIEPEMAIIILSFIGLICAFVYFFVMIPQTYKHRYRIRYKKWHVIHGKMDERIEIEFDERKTPLN